MTEQDFPQLHSSDGDALHGTITASNLAIPSDLVISLNWLEPLVVIHPDGTVELSPNATLDEAARAFWDAVKSMQPTLDQRTGIRNVGAKLRAGAFRDAADTVQALNAGCSQRKPCTSCTAREGAAQALRDRADAEEPCP